MGPWERYGGGQQATPPQGMVVGTPRPPDPFKVRDQQLQEESAARAREDQQFQRQKFEREMAQKDSEKVSDGQRSAAGYYSRALRAHQGYGKGVEPRGAVTQMLVDQLPTGIVNEVQSPERRAAANWADEIIRAKLRRESGASIAPEEMRKEYEVYFPIPGDTEADIARKAGMREQAIEALRNEASGAAETVRVNPIGDIGFNAPDQPKNPLNPEQQRAYDLFFQLNPRATPEQLQQFGASIGVNVENAQAIIDARNKGAGVQPAESAVSGLTPQQQAEVDRIVAQNQGGGSFGAGAGDAVSFGTMDEIAAGIGAVGQSLSGEGSFSDNYSNNVAVNRAVAEQLASRDPALYTGGQIAGGFAIPVGAGARGVGGLAKVGAAQGGAYGFGSSEGNPLQRIPGAVTGAAVGGAVGAGLGAAAPYAENALIRLTQRPNVMARQQEAADALPIIEAGQRQGIPIRQPDARPSTRADFAAVEASQTGNPIVSRAMQADENLVQQRVREVGGNGLPLDDYELGQRVQQTGSDYLARTRSQANALYGRAEQMAGDAQGEPQKALNMLELNISELRETGEKTNAGAIKYLDDLKADLQGGASIAKLRNIRKNMRGQINERNLTATDTERRVGEVLDQLSQDIEGILPANAKQAFRAADSFYRDRMTFKSQVVERFMGPKNNPVSPEQAAARFNSFMKSKDFGRFKRMMGEMDPGDRADIAATVAENLGLARNGEFSLAALSTNIDKFSPRAVRELFGEDGAKAIADLKVIARAKADTKGALNNSRTGVVNERNGLRDIMFGIFGGGVAGIPGAIGGFFVRGAMEKITNARAARLMLNPDFTKWLRQTPQTANPQAINRHFSRLSQVAARDTVFAADVKALQQLLADSFSKTSVKAAAAEEENQRR